MFLSCACHTPTNRQTRRSIRITSFIYIHHERTAAIDSGQLLEHGFIPFPYRIIHVLQDKCCFAHNSSRVTFVTLIFLLLSKWYFKKIDLISLLTYFFKVKQSISGAQQMSFPYVSYYSLPSNAPEQ